MYKPFCRSNPPSLRFVPEMKMENNPLHLVRHLFFRSQQVKHAHVVATVRAENTSMRWWVQPHSFSLCFFFHLKDVVGWGTEKPWPFRSKFRFEIDIKLTHAGCAWNHSGHETPLNQQYFWNPPKKIHLNNLAFLLRIYCDTFKPQGATARLLKWMVRTEQPRQKGSAM